MPTQSLNKLDLRAAGHLGRIKQRAFGKAVRKEEKAAELERMTVNAKGEMALAKYLKTQYHSAMIGGLPLGLKAHGYSIRVLVNRVGNVSKDLWISPDMTDEGHLYALAETMPTKGSIKLVGWLEGYALKDKAKLVETRDGRTMYLLDRRHLKAMSALRELAGIK